MNTKQITQERILKASSRASNWRKEQVERDMELQRPFMMLGMRAMFGGDAELPRHEVDRTRLEVTYSEGPSSPQEWEVLQDRLLSNIDRRNQHRRRIHKLQARAGISGLIRGTYELGGQKFPCWEAREDIRLIESDLALMSSEKQAILEHWLEFCQCRGLKFWQSIDYKDHPCTIQEIQAAVDSCSWVRVFDWDKFNSEEPRIDLSTGWTTDLESVCTMFCFSASFE